MAIQSSMRAALGTWHFNNDDDDNNNDNDGRQGYRLSSSEALALMLKSHLLSVPSRASSPHCVTSAIGC